MPTQKATELRELSDDQLAIQLEDARQALFNLRFQLPTGALERTSEIQIRKREIARILTVAREREIAAQEAARG
ncbi:MAG: 50S ribosomal protein L29 [Actinomycetota bacterium]|nr:50S ribosomal protein L29 [Thermoleophilia bacterium]MDA3005325.1 50S ribosomal protein L29 [Actinomycetota bacterium]